MFNTLIYIPAILAYTFITLLVVILGFIVIYVTHKIYTTLYDNLPVARLSSKSLLNEFEEVTKPAVTLSTKADGQVGRKSKTGFNVVLFNATRPSILVRDCSSMQYVMEIGLTFEDENEYSYLIAGRYNFLRFAVCMFYILLSGKFFYFGIFLFESVIEVYLFAISQ